ncbi:hypothetical protein [Neisseria sp. Ec49-e6-T10]|uniref:hypothetical protein n=1 Tax=Neisseria sp. Ec49-e6-T10 TaxID=3140744 RepID=UPI003EBE459E
MAFVEEELTKEDQQKILRDVQYDEKKYALLKKNLEYYTRPNFASHWIIDHQSGFYLLYVNKNAFETVLDDYFYFYCYGKAYEVIRKAYGEGYFLKDVPEEAKLEEFKEILTKVLAMYYRYDEEGFSIQFKVEQEEKGEL